MKLRPIPLTLREANDFVSAYHRHSGRTSRDGTNGEFPASDGQQMYGVAIVGRPLARLMDDGWTAEVLRTCVSPNAPKGTCSFLYGRSWRIWQQMGGRMITYTLASESGASLKGAGWRMAGESKPHANGWVSKDRSRRWHPIYGQLKLRWEIADGM